MKSIQALKRRERSHNVWLKRRYDGWHVTCVGCMEEWQPLTGAKGRPIGEWWLCPEGCNRTKRIYWREQWELFGSEDFDWDAWTLETLERELAIWERDLNRPDRAPRLAEDVCWCATSWTSSEEHPEYHVELQEELNAEFQEETARAIKRIAEIRSEVFGVLLAAFAEEWRPEHEEAWLAFE